MSLQKIEDFLQKIIEMRHGNPPNFDEAPISSLKEIAKALG